MKTFVLVVLGVFMVFSDVFAGYLTFSIGQGDGSGKYASISKQRHITTHVFAEAELGVIMPLNLIDKDQVGFGELGVGYGISTPFFSEEVYFRIKQGFAVLTSIPKNLTTMWQLPTTINAGISLQDTHFGIVFKHFSNGTINPKNRGLEYMGLEFGLVW